MASMRPNWQQGSLKVVVLILALMVAWTDAMLVVSVEDREKCKQILHLKVSVFGKIYEVIRA